MLKDECEIDILPALGTHVPVTREEAAAMFGDIPYERFKVHSWRTDVEKIGVVPGNTWPKFPRAWFPTPSTWK